MSKTTFELATDIITSLHEELYKDYYRKREFTKPFGEYVAEQFDLIYNGINNSVNKTYQ